MKNFFIREKFNVDITKFKAGCDFIEKRHMVVMRLTDDIFSECPQGDIFLEEIDLLFESCPRIHFLQRIFEHLLSFFVFVF